MKNGIKIIYDCIYWSFKLHAEMGRTHFLAQ
jgi:hypothetical protein